MPSMTIMKHSLATAVLAALPLTARDRSTTPPKVAAACNNVAIFMARGNDAPYHDGRTSSFIDATCRKFQAQGNSCDCIDIVFDATLVPGYLDCNQRLLARCLGSGALLSGGGDDACNVDPQTLGLDSSSQAGQAVKAALLWGDVKHTANQAYKVLNGADKQAWPRTGANLERLSRYYSLLRSYCAAGDPVCVNEDDVAQHLNYFELHTEDASSWVVSKLIPLLAKASSSALPSSSATPTSSLSAISVDFTTVITSTETSTMKILVTVTKTAVKPSTMILSYVPVVTTISSNATSSAISEAAAAYPVTIPHKQYNATAPYSNSTIPMSSTLMTADKPYKTTYLPIEESSVPATTKAPEHSAVAAACPPATVNETVTHVVYEYV